MRVRCVLARAACAGILCGCAAVPPARGQTAPLTHEGVVAAPVEQVWEAFTTAQGLESWMVAHASIDLRIGGKMRTNYQKDGQLGDKHTIENTILAYEPRRMLSIKATRAPEGFPFKSAIENMWTVIHFEPLTPDRTRVRCVSMGFTDDEESQKMRRHFDWGNAYTVRKLQERFARPAATQPATDTVGLLRRFIGGEWRHASQRDNGHMFRAHATYTSGPDGQSITTRTLLGVDDRFTPHGCGQIWREPESRQVRFQNIDENGAVARGEIRAVAADTLEWDWNSRALDGTVTPYRVRTILESADRYRMELYLLEDGGPRQLFNLIFNRAGGHDERGAASQPADDARR